MEIVALANPGLAPVEEYGIVGTAHAASIAFGSGEAHVRCFRGAVAKKTGEARLCTL